MYRGDREISEETSDKAEHPLTVTAMKLHSNTCPTPPNFTFCCCHLPSSPTSLKLNCLGSLGRLGVEGILKRMGHGSVVWGCRSESELD